MNKRINFKVSSRLFNEENCVHGYCCNCKNTVGDMHGRCCHQWYWPFCCVVRHTMDKYAEEQLFQDCSTCFISHHDYPMNTDVLAQTGDVIGFFEYKEPSCFAESINEDYNCEKLTERYFIWSSNFRWWRSEICE